MSTVFPLASRRATLSLIARLGLAGMLCGTAGCADREGEAREAVKAAAFEVLEARKLERESFDAALERYETALDSVDQVRQEYADTPTAALLNKPGTYLGPVTLGTLEKVILPAVRRRAEAEASPLACAAFMAETIPAPTPRVQAVCAVARAASSLARQAIAQRMVQVATATAHGLPAGSEARDRAFEALADALINTRELEKARSLILAHGFEAPWQRLAIALVKTGQTRRAAGMVTHALGGDPLARLEARTVIGTALWREGNSAGALAMMQEAERWAKLVPPDQLTQAGLFLTRNFAVQRALQAADAWLSEVDGLRSANRETLDALVEAYREGGGEARLLQRVHAGLRTIEAGTEALPASEVPWLANIAYLQAKLGESEPGAFALSQARIRADGIAPDDRLPLLAQEVTTLLDIGERLVQIRQQQPGLDAIEDALKRLDGLPAEQHPAIISRAAGLTALGGKSERTVALIEKLTLQDEIAVALAQATQISRGSLMAPKQRLHDLVARFDTLEGLR